MLRITILPQSGPYVGQIFVICWDETDCDGVLAEVVSLYTQGAINLDSLAETCFEMGRLMKSDFDSDSDIPF